MLFRSATLSSVSFTTSIIAKLTPYISTIKMSRIVIKIAEYKNKLQLPIFMTMRDILMVEIYGVNFAIIDVVKETELSVAAMKKQKESMRKHCSAR